MAKNKHKIRRMALITIACSCGWFWRNENLRGKKDDTLEQETMDAFMNHQMEMEAQGF